MGLGYWDAVRSAVRGMTYLLMAALGLSLEEANCVVIRGSLRNGAIWMVSDHHLITMVERDDRIRRTVFLGVPLGPVPRSGPLGNALQTAGVSGRISHG